MKHFKDTEEGEAEVYRGTGYLQELAREEERKNTERERKRAEEAERKIEELEKEIEVIEKEIEVIEKEIEEINKKREEQRARVIDLEAQLNNVMALPEKNGIKPE